MTALQWIYEVVKTLEVVYVTLLFYLQNKYISRWVLVKICVNIVCQEKVMEHCDSH